MRLKHVNRLIFTNLNINSLWNKFEFSVELVKNKFDFLMISETTIKECLPLGQFKIDSYITPFRLDRNNSGNDIMPFVREGITAKLIGSEKPPIEGFYVEMNLRKQKWLISCSYNPNKSMIGQYLEALSNKGMDLHSSTYANFIFLGDFNAYKAWNM